MTATQILDWRPDQAAIDFIADLIARLNDGGQWEVPRNGQKYIKDNQAKQFVLVKGRVDELFYMNDMTAQVLGWRFILSPKYEADTGYGKTNASAQMP